MFIIERLGRGFLEKVDTVTRKRLTTSFTVNAKSISPNRHLRIFFASWAGIFSLFLTAHVADLSTLPRIARPSIFIVSKPWACTRISGIVNPRFSQSPKFVSALCCSKRMFQARCRMRVSDEHVHFSPSPSQCYSNILSIIIVPTQTVLSWS
jgi:hypothetical protein